MKMHAQFAAQLFTALLFVTAPFSAAQARELWLAGGHLPACSSSGIKVCRSDARAAAEAFFHAHDALTSTQYRLGTASLDLPARGLWWPAQTRSKAQLSDWLRDQLGNGQVSTGQTGDGQADIRAERIWNAAQWQQLMDDAKFSADEQLWLADHLEWRQLDRNGRSRRDQVYWPGMDPVVRDLYRDFVNRAGQRSSARDNTRKPRIGLITASARDVFSAVEYYRSVFAAAGAEVIWLPVEPALAQSTHCDQLVERRAQLNAAFARERRYPELAAEQLQACQNPAQLMQALDSVDALFINGGDQSLTLKSLHTVHGEFSAFGKRLLQRLDEGVLLGGTSAGTAVQTGNASGTLPMISNGSSAHAARHGSRAVTPPQALCAVFGNCPDNWHDEQLSYRAGGGLGSFPFGVLDTHFRERDRELRLLRLLLDTGTDAGFGIDETTVLHARFDHDDGAQLSVSGKGGVWFIQRDGATLQTKSGGWRAGPVSATRLLAGDRAALIRKPADAGDTANAWTLDAQLGCPLPETLDGARIDTGRVDADRVDDAAFAPRDGRRWQRQWRVANSDQQAGLACMRGDGRWRYRHLQLTLEQDL